MHDSPMSATGRSAAQPPPSEPRSDQDDVDYRNNVKTMAVVLAAIVITIFAALLVSTYLPPAAVTFQPSVSVPSAQGFTLNLSVNATSVPQGGEVNITSWAQSTDRMIDNVTAQDAWGVGEPGLWFSKCGEPVGIGIMQGYYTADNFTQGTLMPLGNAPGSCTATLPRYFLFEYDTSKALVVENSTGYTWTIGASTTTSSTLAKGVYTVIAADEWGDVVLTNFQVT